MRTLRIHSLNNSPVNHTAVLTVVIMIYIIFLVLIYLKNGILYLLTSFLHFSFPPLPLVTTNLISFSVIWEFCFFLDFTYK